ncbi:unnamed protein product [Rhizophagus irregularis]|uniref:Uncharacterized protein n=1 Tax=Rhizophagus irregularis TaxID=588596 RepID=A0A915Z9S6_9GLOM|nr:unnamed protein product [Rhizophagus irregularis]CAB5368546.1 unnamed protein product [Rhizophagus irregularis]
MLIYRIITYQTDLIINSGLDLVFRRSDSDDSFRILWRRYSDGQVFFFLDVLFFWVLEREFWNFLSLDMEPWYFFQVSRHEDVNRSVVNTGFFYRCSHVKCW